MILLYHHICPKDTIPTIRARWEGWQFSISPGAFEKHILTLLRKKYSFISLTERTEEIEATGREPSGKVTITFDDGWMDNYEYALPILLKYKIPACFFLITADMEHKSNKMSTAEIIELLAAGMEIGSHTRTHPENLTVLPLKKAEKEILYSKRELEERLGVATKFFAYPGGAFNTAIVEIVRAAGYKAACSILGPSANDRASLFWLYRSTLTENLDRLGDKYRLSPFLTKALSVRVIRRLRRRLTS